MAGAAGVAAAGAGVAAVAWFLLRNRPKKHGSALAVAAGEAATI